MYSSRLTPRTWQTDCSTRLWCLRMPSSWCYRSWRSNAATIPWTNLHLCLTISIYPRSSLMNSKRRLKLGKSRRQVLSLSLKFLQTVTGLTVNKLRAHLHLSLRTSQLSLRTFTSRSTLIVTLNGFSITVALRWDLFSLPQSPTHYRCLATNQLFCFCSTSTRSWLSVRLSSWRTSPMVISHQLLSGSATLPRKS